MIVSFSTRAQFGGLGDGGALCDSIFKSSAFGCSDGAGAQNSGGSFPLLFDAFNLNPSTIPTYLTPAGLEVYKGEEDLNFALIKGLKNFGMGLSKKFTETTFFSPVENYRIAIKERLSEYSNVDLDSILNIGFALELLNINKSISLPLGISARYNEEKSVWSLVYGTSFKLKNFSISGSYYLEKPDPYGNTTFTTAETSKVLSVISSLKFANFLFDYTYISNKRNVTETFTYGTNFSYQADYRVKTNIFSVGYKYQNLLFTWAKRKQESSGLPVTSQAILSSLGGTIENEHVLLGLRYIAKKFSLGLYNNYELGSALNILGQFYF
ncbi:MAG: hypothetical protein GY909_01090 [Oligoflexia bacterium]|nr:hypothetical protein [Oligoflexia bacterium]